MGDARVRGHDREERASRGVRARRASVAFSASETLNSVSGFSMLSEWDRRGR